MTRTEGQNDLMSYVGTPARTKSFIPNIIFTILCGKYVSLHVKSELANIYQVVSMM